MTTDKRRHGKHEPLPGEAPLAGLYRAGGREEPPAALDAKILAEARRATARPAARSPFGSHWALPLSLAAVVVIAFGVVLLLSEQGALDHHDTLPESAEPSPARVAPATPLAERKPLAEAPAAAAPAGAPAAAPTTSVTPNVVEAKKAAPAIAAAPPMQMETERRAPVAEDRARATGLLAKEAATTMSDKADVISVSVRGQPGAYDFLVGIRSPDKGCAQYADWWEVVSEDGKLLYRRVLLHSHVDEQPFSRSGGPVPIKPDTVVWVRAHMNTSGYGGAALKGSVKTGFKPAVLDSGFAVGLSKQPPLPEGCDF